MIFIHEKYVCKGSESIATCFLFLFYFNVFLSRTLFRLYGWNRLTWCRNVHFSPLSSSLLIWYAVVVAALFFNSIMHKNISSQATNTNRNTHLNMRLFCYPYRMLCASPHLNQGNKKETCSMQNGIALYAFNCAIFLSLFFSPHFHAEL